MCTTCGCGNTDEITFRKPGDQILTDTLHHHGHHHHHHHHEHGHAHDHHHHHHHTENRHGEKTLVELEQDILLQNNLIAERVRGFLAAKNILALNLVSSPGSGKTSILERTLKDLKDRIKFYVIEGDQQTMNDANRIDAVGIPVLQINTGKACHLDSEMVWKALQSLQPESQSVLMIENVGNLVCPAGFDLGENKRVVIISTTEGDDKPLKYPDMFEGSDICLINKIDLLPYVPFDVEKAKDYARRINPHIRFFEVSALTGQGMDGWYDWLISAFQEQTGFEVNK